MALLIDIGSTNIKYKMNDNEIKTIPFPDAINNNYPYYEVNPLEIYGIIKSVIDRGNEKDVFISVQMHGYVLLKSGREVTPYISWRDERGKNIKPDFNITKEYGVNVKPNLPRLSLETNEKDFDEFCTLGSYIAYKLTGNNKTHITDLSPSGFLNVVKKKTDKTDFKLPDYSSYIEIIGRYNDINIYTPIGDQQASILGATYKTGFNGYILNLGTASQLCTVNENFMEGEYESRPYFNQKFLLTVTYLPGGAYISSHTLEEIEDEVYKKWKHALDILPERNEILVTGGLLKSRFDFIEKELKKLNIKYIFNNDFDALEGLHIISEGLIK